MRERGATSKAGIIIRKKLQSLKLSATLSTSEISIYNLTNLFSKNVKHFPPTYICIYTFKFSRKRKIVRSLVNSLDWSSIFSSAGTSTESLVFNEQPLSPRFYRIFNSAFISRAVSVFGRNLSSIASIVLPLNAPRFKFRARLRAAHARSATRIIKLSPTYFDDFDFCGDRVGVGCMFIGIYLRNEQRVAGWAVVKRSRTRVKI